MKKYQKRVCHEADDLKTKLSQLEDFMYGNTYADMLAVEKGLLMVQYEAMKMYLDALQRRIQLF